jgi:hypothetical protein
MFLLRLELLADRMLQPASPPYLTLRDSLLAKLIHAHHLDTLHYSIISCDLLNGERMVGHGFHQELRNRDNYHTKIKCACTVRIPTAHSIFANFISLNQETIRLIRVRIYATTFKSRTRNRRSQIWGSKMGKNNKDLRTFPNNILRG